MGSWWRVVVALVAFLLWAHPSFVGLPFAALLFLVPGSRGEWTYALAGSVGAASAGLLVLLSAGPGRLGAMTSAYIVLVTATFVALLVLTPPPPRSFLRLGVRAVVLGMAATLLLVQVIWGSSGLGELRWEVLRNVSGVMRIVVAIMPRWFALYEPAVRFFTLTWPAMLGLQALAGLAIAWHLHRRTADVMPDHAPAGGGTPDVVPDAAPITT